MKRQFLCKMISFTLAAVLTVENSMTVLASQTAPEAAQWESAFSENTPAEEGEGIVQEGPETPDTGDDGTVLETRNLPRGQVRNRRRSLPRGRIRNRQRSFPRNLQQSRVRSRRQSRKRNRNRRLRKKNLPRRRFLRRLRYRFRARCPFAGTGLKKRTGIMFTEAREKKGSGSYAVRRRSWGRNRKRKADRNRTQGSLSLRTGLHSLERPIIIKYAPIL